ncbi:MAG: flagellar biosynthetic protein FliO [Nitrospinae bacterium]|nr:flagellar biosynthetic protein FliO [Nitrospinota bacterium]
MNGELLSNITTMFSALALVLGIFLVALYLATYLRGKGQRGRWIKVLAATDVGGKRTIALVEVVDEVLVLGLAPQQISLLSRVEKPEVVRRLKMAEQPKPATSFLEYLERMLARRRGASQPAPANKRKEQIHA